MTNNETTPVDDGGVSPIEGGFGLGEKLGLLCLELFVGDVTGVT